jgi:hypothetical protein
MNNVGCAKLNADTRNFPTLSTSIANLIKPVVLLMNLKLVELSCDMISSTSIHVPVYIYSIGTFGVVSGCVINITITPSKLTSGVSFICTYLANYALLQRGRNMTLFGLPTPLWAGVPDLKHEAGHSW